MGNTQSEQNNDNLGSRDKEKILQQNLLNQERIKNQILEDQLEQIQKEIQNSNSSHLYKKSNIPLLSNPNLQKEVFNNKNFKKQLLQKIIQQNNEYNSKNLNEQQYNQINNLLQNLDIDELNNKNYLHLNQDFSQSNIFKEGEEKKLNIGNNNIDRDKLLKLLKQQKLTQEQKMKEEQIKKQKEYQNKINNINELNIDPYKILNLQNNATFPQAKNAFKKLARIYHPDKFNGNDTQFKLITKAFMILVDKFKQQESDKQFYQLKEESDKNLKTQLNESKKNINMKNMEGRNFNNKLFNQVYKDNRLYSPHDEGYNNWISDNTYSSDKINKTLNSYDKNNFNNVFNDLKKNKKSTQIQKYSQPEAVSSISNIDCETLGQGNIQDFSSSVDITKKKHNLRIIK